MNGVFDCNRLFLIAGRWIHFQGIDQYGARSIDEQKATVFALEITKLAARNWIVDQRLLLPDSDQWQLEMPLELNDTTTDSDAKQRDIDTRPEDWKPPSQRLIDAAKRDVPAAIGEKFDRADVREHDGRRAIVAKALVKALIKLGHREDASPWAVHELIEEKLLEAVAILLPKITGYVEGADGLMHLHSEGFCTLTGLRKFEGFRVVTTSAFQVWARTLSELPKSDQYTLGKLILDLESDELLQNAMQADMKTRGLAFSRPRFKRDDSTMPDIRRIELLCRKHGYGTELTPSSAKKLRAKVAKMKHYSLTKVDGLSLNEAADILEGKQTMGSNPQPRGIPKSIKELADGEFKQRATGAWRSASLLVRVMTEWETWFNELTTEGDADPGVAVDLHEKGAACLRALSGLQVDIKAIRDKATEQLAAQFPTWPWPDLDSSWQKDQAYLHHLRRTKDLIHCQEWRRLMGELLGFLQLLETSPTVAMLTSPSADGQTETGQAEVDAGTSAKQVQPSQKKRGRKSLTPEAKRRRDELASDWKKFKDSKSGQMKDFCKGKGISTKELDRQLSAIRAEKKCTKSFAK